MAGSNVVALGSYRFDGWENTLTGFGTTRDKTTYGNFLRSLVIGDNHLEALYAESDLAATAIDCVPEEMLRRGYELRVSMKAEAEEPAQDPSQETKPGFNKLAKPEATDGVQGEQEEDVPTEEDESSDPDATSKSPVLDPSKEPTPDDEGETGIIKRAPQPNEQPGASNQKPGGTFPKGPKAEQPSEDPSVTNGQAPKPVGPAPRENDPKLAKAIRKALSELNAHNKITEADCWGRLYGGAVVAIIADDGRPAEMPLVPENVRKVQSLLVIDRRYITPMTFYAEGPKAGEPEVFMVHKTGGSRLGGTGQILDAFLIHETRLLIFRGVRTTLTERMGRNYWDHSLLMRAFPIVRSFDTAFKAVETLLTDGAQAVFKMKGLQKYIGGSGEAALQARMQVVDMMRSVTRAMVIDSEEEFERHNYTYSGLGEVLDKLMLRLAAAFRVPVTILMGQSPAGMNATGESDFRWFYDRIATRQENYYEPLLTRLIEVICASKEGPTKGKVPEKIEFEWLSLWEPTDKEKAETEKIKADTAVAYIGADVVTPEEVALGSELPEGYAVDIEMRHQAQAATKEMAAMDPMALRPHAPAPPGQAPELDEDGNPVEPPEGEDPNADNPPGLPVGPKAGPAQAKGGPFNQPGKKKAAKKPPFA
jgi:phage-related protein (TIGR01555 family)